MRTVLVRSIEESSEAYMCCLVAKFYKTPEVFTCISNPSVKIPFSSVNDDVCDCPDGSDEV